jgi:flagellar basal body-associated protein FliL
METKNCPYCGEEILAIAKKCKHCGEWIDNQKIEIQKKMIECPFCAEEIEDGLEICPLCKEPLGKPTKKEKNLCQEEKPKKEKSKIFRIIMVIVLFIVAIVCLIYSKTDILDEPVDNLIDMIFSNPSSSSKTPEDHYRDNYNQIKWDVALLIANTETVLETSDASEWLNTFYLFEYLQYWQKDFAPKTTVSSTIKLIKKFNDGILSGDIETETDGELLELWTEWLKVFSEKFANRYTLIRLEDPVVISSTETGATLVIGDQSTKFYDIYVTFSNNFEKLEVNSEEAGESDDGFEEVIVDEF